MIRKEEKSSSTGLFYGANCTAPRIVLLANTGRGPDYHTWIAFNATSELMQKNIAVKQNKVIKHGALLYVKQDQLRNWYTNEEGAEERCLKHGELRETSCVKECDS